LEVEGRKQEARRRNKQASRRRKGRNRELGEGRK
jgi:hypothetical protein